MEKNILFILFVGIVAYAAQLGTMTRTTDVVTQSELAAYTVDPDSLQAQITANATILSDGITTNLLGLAITNGIVKGTYTP